MRAAHETTPARPTPRRHQSRYLAGLSVAVGLIFGAGALSAHAEGYNSYPQHRTAVTQRNDFLLPLDHVQVSSGERVPVRRQLRRQYGNDRLASADITRITVTGSALSRRGSVVLAIGDWCSDAIRLRRGRNAEFRVPRHLRGGRVSILAKGDVQLNSIRVRVDNDYRGFALSNRSNSRNYHNYSNNRNYRTDSKYRDHRSNRRDRRDQRAHYGNDHLWSHVGTYRTKKNGSTRVHDIGLPRGTSHVRLRPNARTTYVEQAWLHLGSGKRVRLHHLEGNVGGRRGERFADIGGAGYQSGHATLRLVTRAGQRRHRGYIEVEAGQPTRHASASKQGRRDSKADTRGGSRSRAERIRS